MLHRVVAVLLVIIYFLIFTGSLEYYSGFNDSQNAVNELDMDMYNKASSGLGYIYLIAGFSCYCLLFPKAVSESLSPRVGGLQSLLLKADFWVVVGYFSACVTFFILEAFK